MVWSLFLQRVLAAAAVLGVGDDLRGQEPQKSSPPAIVWKLDNLSSIEGYQATVVGAPRVVNTNEGGIEFDGKDDGLFLDTNPLAGLSQFTVEVVFRPAPEGPKEQRFLHFQESGTENRLLFETRLTGDGRWFLDTFLKSGDGNYTLLATDFTHPIGRWYHAAVVIDGKTMRHFVNGKEELAAAIHFQPLQAGQTSLGVRINKVSWYKGAIRLVRITPRALAPSDFLSP
jgi:hypothetical protein